MTLSEKQIKTLEALTEQEMNLIMKQIKQPEKKINTFDHFYNEKHTKVLVMSDTHIGSKYFREDIFQDLLKIIKKEKPDAVYHSGDIIEGMSNREGHIYELSIMGTSNQATKAIELFKQIEKPLFFTTGNHDEWSKVKSNQGYLLGQDLEKSIPNSKFLGEYTADIKFSEQVTMRLTHEGASAYALSYSGQKRVNAIEGGTKPAIIINGHIHKLLYMYYRNIHYFEAGCLQDQTPFMRMKGTPAMKGFWLLDIYHNKNGITKLRQTAYPYY
jgi:predicted phosphodiesterase